MQGTWLFPDSQRVYTKKAYQIGDPRIKPIEGLVIHYTAGPDKPLFPRIKAWAETDPSVNEASTCIAVSRRPKEQPTLQLTPIEARAWHAGGSVWTDGKGNVNARCLGLDFDNVGFLQKRAGVLCDAYGRTYKGPTPFVDDGGTAWEPYTEESVLEMCRIVLMLADIFPGIKGKPEAVQGHEHIRSTKRDPGPAFSQYWSALRGCVSGVFPSGLREV